MEEYQQKVSLHSENLKTTDDFEFSISDIISERKRLWQNFHDISVDREFVATAVRMILSDKRLVEEIKNKPYLLIEIAFTIVDKDKNNVPFFLNEVQADFIKQLEIHKTEKPYFILKGRQQGFTSLITAIQLSFAITVRNFSGFTIADNDGNAKAIFNDKARMVYSKLPRQLKPAEKFNSARELFFDKLGSSWRISTATDNVGRSRTLSFVHFSEVAFYQCELSLLQKGIGEALTKNAYCIYETTANGFNDAKSLWDSGSCVNLFYEWWKTAEYRCDDFQFIEKADKWLSERIALLRKMGLDESQIAWYAKKYDSYLDKSTIRQEYPINPDEAFVSSGECVFDKDVVISRLSEIYNVKPAKIGKFKYKKTSVPILDSDGVAVENEYFITDIEFVEDDNGFIFIYEEPRVRKNGAGEVTEKCPYVIGGDTAGLGTDYFTGKVIDNISGKSVATLRKQKIDEDEYGAQMFCLGKYYNDALIGIETNYSRYPTRVLQKYRYPKLYFRERLDRLTDEVEKIPGFETTSKTKPIIIGNFVELFRSDPDIEQDRETLREMSTFVRKENGKLEAMRGCHDDLVMADAIAHFICSQQSHDWITAEGESDGVIDSNFSRCDDNEENFISWDY